MNGRYNDMEVNMSSNADLSEVHKKTSRAGYTAFHAIQSKCLGVRTQDTVKDVLLLCNGARALRMVPGDY